MREKTKSNMMYTVWGLSLFSTYLATVWGSLILSIVCGTISLLVLLARKRMEIPTEPLSNGKAYLALCALIVIAFGIWGYTPLVILCSFIGANVILIMYAFDTPENSYNYEQGKLN